MERVDHTSIKQQETRQQKSPAKRLAMIGLFTAFACVATMVIHVPSPTGGYMNLGDTVVLLGAYFLGPVYGAVAGGMGSALADLLSGYPVYVPATLIIKALMAVIAGSLYQAFGKKHGFPGLILYGIVGEIPMVLGYWLFDAILAISGGTTQFGAALAISAAGIPSNLLQAAFGIAASTLLAGILLRSAAIRKNFLD